MWRDHPFSQRNKTTERALGVGVGGDRKRGGGGQNLKNSYESTMSLASTYSLLAIKLKFVIHLQMLKIRILHVCGLKHTV